MLLSEVDGPLKHKLKSDLVVDTWERWEVEISEKTKLSSIVKTLEQTFNLHSRDVMLGPTSIFSYAFRDMDLPRHQQP